MFFSRWQHLLLGCLITFNLYQLLLPRIIVEILLKYLACLQTANCCKNSRVIVETDNQAPLSSLLDAPAPSPAVFNGGGCVPDSNGSPAVYNPPLAHSALDLFSSLPTSSSVSSTKTTVGDNTLYILYTLCMHFPTSCH